MGSQQSQSARQSINIKELLTIIGEKEVRILSLQNALLLSNERIKQLSEQLVKKMEKNKVKDVGKGTKNKKGVTSS